MHHSSKTIIQQLALCIVFLSTLTSCKDTSSFPVRKLSAENETSISHPYIQQMLNNTLDIVSMIINILKRGLVLTALLFLIENLINFWVLASSYTFLFMTIPAYLDQTIYLIYKEHNSSFITYLGLDLNYPDIITSNPSSLNKLNNHTQFQVINFLIEPTFLIILTLIELSLLQCFIRGIKKIIRKKREIHVEKVIEKQINKRKKDEYGQNGYKQENQTVKDVSKQTNAPSFFSNILKSNKIANQNQIEVKIKTNNKEQTKQFQTKLDKGKVQIQELNSQQTNKQNTNRLQSMMLQFTYQVLAGQVKEEMKKHKEQHWSEDIHISKVEKLSALLINYMTGMLIPAYSLFINNKISTISQKIALFIYYFLLAGIMFFPFIYAIIVLNKKKSNKQQFIKFKDSDVQTLSQYCLNLCMSVCLGVHSTPIPFFLVTTTILTVMLLYSLTKGSNKVSLSTCSSSKMNQFLHKLTFWLYNLVFLIMFLLTKIIEVNPENAIGQKCTVMAYYCSLLCLLIFIIGGCHELIEFGIKTLTTLCQIVHMLYQVCTNQEDDQQSEIGQNMKLKIKKKIKKEKSPQQQERQEEKIVSSPKNVFDFEERESENDSLDIEINKFNNALDAALYS